MSTNVMVVHAEYSIIYIPLEGRGHTWRGVYHELVSVIMLYGGGVVI